MRFDAKIFGFFVDYLYVLVPRNSCASVWKTWAAQNEKFITAFELALRYPEEKLVEFSSIMIANRSLHINHIPQHLLLILI